MFVAQCSMFSVPCSMFDIHCLIMLYAQLFSIFMSNVQCSKFIVTFLCAILFNVNNLCNLNGNVLESLMFHLNFSILLNVQYLLFNNIQCFIISQIVIVVRTKYMNASLQKERCYIHMGCVTYTQDDGRKVLHTHRVCYIHIGRWSDGYCHLAAHLAASLAACVLGRALGRSGQSSVVDLPLSLIMFDVHCQLLKVQRLVFYCLKFNV